MSRYKSFDRSRLLIKPLAERTHDLQLGRWLALDEAPKLLAYKGEREMAEKAISRVGTL